MEQPRPRPNLEATFESFVRTYGYVGLESLSAFVGNETLSEQHVRLKMNQFMSLAGQDTGELSELNPAARQLAAAIAYEVISPQEVASALNVESPEEVWELFTGFGGTDTESIDRLLESYVEEFAIHDESWRSLIPAALDSIFPERNDRFAPIVNMLQIIATKCGAISSSDLLAVVENAKKELSQEDISILSSLIRSIE